MTLTQKRKNLAANTASNCVKQKGRTNLHQVRTHFCIFPNLIRENSRECPLAFCLDADDSRDCHLLHLYVRRPTCSGLFRFTHAVDLVVWLLCLRVSARCTHGPFHGLPASFRGPVCPDQPWFSQVLDSLNVLEAGRVGRHGAAFSIAWFECPYAKMATEPRYLWEKTSTFGFLANIISSCCMLCASS